MKRSTDRILTSHTGALHMPPELQHGIVARHLGEPHDEAAVDAQLREAVAGIVRRQADLGVDVVNDGEYSKSTWMGYVVERLSGLERVPIEGAPMFNASKDRTDFARFYEEMGPQTFYFEPEEMRVLGLGHRERGRVHRPRRVHGPRGHPARHRQPQGRAGRRRRRGGVPPGRRARAACSPTSATSTTPTTRRSSRRSSDALRTEYRAIVDAGFICQIDDAFLPWEWDRRLMEEGWNLEEYRRWATPRGRGAERGAGRAARGSAALPHLLGQLERPARHRHPAARHRRHRAEGQRAGVLDRGGERAARVGAPRLGGREAARRQDPHAGRHRAHDARRRAPGDGRRADRALRERVVGRENVIAGTDCGLRGRAHPEIAWAKLQALSEGAAIASRRLWA